MGKGTEPIDEAQQGATPGAAEGATASGHVHAGSMPGSAGLPTGASEPADPHPAGPASDADPKSTDSKLTFRAAEAAYATAGIAWDPGRPGDARATLLLSDQNPYAVKVMRFADEDETEVLDARTFSGSVIAQLDQTLAYLAPIISAPATGLLTAGRPSYPARAVREALLNAIIHRDYGYTGPVIVNVYPRHIDVISLGGLVGDLQINDLLNGICQPRNDALAGAFAELGIARGYGSGIRTIMREYRDQHISPQLRVAPSSVAVILPVVSGLVGVRDAESDAAAGAESGRGAGSGTGRPRTGAKIYRFPTGEALNAITPLKATPLTAAPVAPAAPAMPAAPTRDVPTRDLPAVPTSPGAAVVPEDLPAPVYARLDRSEVETTTLAYLIRRGIPLRRVEIQEPLNLTKNQMNYALNHLVESGQVLRLGSSRATQYVAAAGSAASMRS
ncbi:Crp/Fnr family transcriptional regulator [Bifidobacterium sp. DSM 109958]|uniref:Crp/Fnr family transcriptional regulator n=1 Tax=Bifidobacterium moraviense TaxID=2675323 RepID=A0A7Y0F2V1_9BIFI|nr:ATP-binding protein [Bifidobacterium sp. DSM 109958]NMN00062.1 Crp/Fnr family transcriptional regulator [Bifidobacterium sp. DSM 109958]